MDSRRTFSAKARDYMLAYDTIQKMEENGSQDKEREGVSQAKLDKIVGHRKSHRGVGPDETWVKSVLEAMKDREIHQN